jgi:two-component system response regulator FixJ
MMLRSAGYDVHLWPDGPSFLEGVDALVPACALLDVRMPGLSGIDVHEMLKERALPIATIILTGHGDVATAVQVLRAGASNFLEKPIESSALVTAVDDALASLARQGTADRRSSNAVARLASLSPRERDVLSGLAAGKQNKSIALDLGISPRTVEVYRANIMDKLGANSLSDVLYVAFAAES